MYKTCQGSVYGNLVFSYIFLFHCFVFLDNTVRYFAIPNNVFNDLKPSPTGVLFLHYEYCLCFVLWQFVAPPEAPKRLNQRCVGCTEGGLLVFWLTCSMWEVMATAFYLCQSAPFVGVKAERHWEISRTRKTIILEPFVYFLQLLLFLQPNYHLLKCSYWMMWLFFFVSISYILQFKIWSKSMLNIPHFSVFLYVGNRKVFFKIAHGVCEQY